MVTVPAFPWAEVLAATVPPLVRLRLVVVISTPPAFPLASPTTLLKIPPPVCAPPGSSPSIEIVSLAVMLTIPAFP